MNDLPILHRATSEQYLSLLQNKLDKQFMLDDHRNLSLADCSEQDFLEFFFFRESVQFRQAALSSYD